MPDLYFCAAMGSGMAELKISSGKRKLVLRYPVHQRIWARDHVRAGGIHLLIVKHAGTVLWWFGESCAVPESVEPFHEGIHWPKKCPQDAGINDKGERNVGECN